MEANRLPAPVFDTDEQTYVLVTLPVNSLSAGQVNDFTRNQVNLIIFKQLEDIITFSNQAGNQVGNQAKAILMSMIELAKY